MRKHIFIVLFLLSTNAYSKSFVDSISDDPEFKNRLHKLETELIINQNNAKNLTDLADELWLIDKNKEAEDLYRRALEIYEKESDVNNIAFVSSQLAYLLYSDDKKLEEAELLYKKALNNYNNALNENEYNPYKVSMINAHIVHNLKMLGRIYIKQFKYKQAEILIRRALDICETLPYDEFNTTKCDFKGLLKKITGNKKTM